MSVRQFVTANSPNVVVKANYAFKRTAGTGHDVSYFIGPRPLNAALDRLEGRMAAQPKSLVAFAHVADVERSIRFYSGLGFRVENSVVPAGQAAPVWAWLKSEEANLMVGLASEPVDPAQQAVLFYMYYDNIGQTRTILKGLGYEPGDIKLPFYMPRGEFRLEDPDGYVLMLAQI